MRRVLVVGDFNIKPGPEDVWDCREQGEEFYLPHESAWLHGLLGGGDGSGGPFRDTFRMFHPEGEGGQALVEDDSHMGLNLNSWVFIAAGGMPSPAGTLPRAQERTTAVRGSTSS